MWALVPSLSAFVAILVRLLAVLDGTILLTLRLERDDWESCVAELDVLMVLFVPLAIV